MKSPDVAGRSYEDGLPIVKTKLEDRMKWIWSEDMDEVYETARYAWRRSSSA
jgi:salicylate hydroxylase